MFCCSRGQVRSSCGFVYTGTRVRREGGAHTNLTTANSTAGKGFVTLFSLPTITSSTWRSRYPNTIEWIFKNYSIRSCETTRILRFLRIPPALQVLCRLLWPSAGLSCEMKGWSEKGSRRLHPRLSGCRRTLRAPEPKAGALPQIACLWMIPESQQPQTRDRQPAETTQFMQQGSFINTK